MFGLNCSSLIMPLGGSNRHYFVQPNIKFCSIIVSIIIVLLTFIIINMCFVINYYSYYKQKGTDQPARNTN